ncbi:MAG: septation protein spoVG [Candidatus Hydrogenedentota bacterium]|nr:MAG: septation protein spoVG [Candidatus Hydrogenedentota bacterium]
MVEITRTQVYARGDGKNTIGYAHITLGDTFVVKNLRIVKGRKGIFVGMPSNRSKRGDYIDIFFPINQEARKYLTETVITAFRSEYPELLEGEVIYGLDEQ